MKHLLIATLVVTFSTKDITRVEDSRSTNSIEIATDFLKSVEKFSEGSYIDSAGVRTIGYGFTRSNKSKISKFEASKILNSKCREIRKKILRDLPSNKLSPNKEAVLISFAYNCGYTAFKSSTLFNKVKSKEYSEVPNQLLRWVKITKVKNGRKFKVVSRGLRNRRIKEINLWNKN